jgi:hypothetical protein
MISWPHSLAEDTQNAGRIELDADDPDGQTILAWYPEIEPAKRATSDPLSESNPAQSQHLTQIDPL